MGNSEKAPCSGNCSLESMIVTLENMGEARESSEEGVTLSASARAVAAKTAMYRDIYDSMPKDNCVGNKLTNDCEEQCPKRNIFNAVVANLNINETLVGKGGVPMISRELRNDLIAEAVTNQVDAQISQMEAAKETQEKIQTERPELFAAVQQARQAAQMGARPQPIPNFAQVPQPNDGTGHGQYL